MAVSHRARRSPQRIAQELITLLNLKYIIEYQGQQHYEPIERFGGIERFNLQQKYDNMKKEYCKKNNIQLLVIPYWENNIEKIIKEFYYVQKERG